MEDVKFSPIAEGSAIKMIADDEGFWVKKTDYENLLKITQEMLAILEHVEKQELKDTTKIRDIIDKYYNNNLPL